MRLTRNFYLSEMDCNDGVPVPEALISNAKELAKNLQVIRDEVGVPIRIISAYRTKSWNKKVGGVKDSQHLLCKAADIVTKEHTPVQLHKIVRNLMKQGKIKDGGLGLYPSFIHYDIRSTPARW